MVPHYRLETFSGGNKGSLFGSSVIVNLVCSSLRVSDKHGILGWCTASVTFFRFVQAATVLFRATETLGVAKTLRLTNRDILKLS